MIGLILACLVNASASDPMAFAGRWEAIPWVADGKTEFAGEGAQWPRSLAVDTSGTRVLAGIDVGGIFRSEDGGAKWTPANAGYWARGAAALSFDPRNSNRVVAIAGNTSPTDFHGVWMSLDGGKSWSSRLKVNMGGISEIREQLVWDTTSFDASRQLTKRVLWSRVKKDQTGWGKPDQHPALYRSTDGGDTWAELPNSSAYAGGIIRAQGTVVYSANPDGLFRSENFGETWRKIREGTFTGLDLSPSKPNWVWASTPDKVLRSSDGGKSWTERKGPSESGYILRNIKVSPADSSRMVLWRDQDPNHWDYRRYSSSDGGETWTQCKFETANAFLPVNSRQGIFAWHPTNPNIVWSIGGDIITKSTDGGKTFVWSNRGNNGVLVGGTWSFCAQNPDVIFAGSQDYNGALTVNSGKTWKYANVSGNGWGGFTYGGYALNSKVMWVGNSDSWGGKRILRVSKDGGSTFIDTGIELKGNESSYGDPKNPKVGFAYNHRTSDGGDTWKPMNGCKGVFTHDESGALYGLEGAKVVRSRDGGVTWTVLATAEDNISDLAIDGKGIRIYAVYKDRAHVFANGAWTPLDCPKNQFGWYTVKTVAVDPKNPDRIYVGSAGNWMMTTTAVVASADGGKSWTNLTLQTAPVGNQLDGGREAICIRVHPKTGDVWTSTSCFGVWRYVRNSR